MNPQHKLSKLENRRRRISRRIAQIETEKQGAIDMAKDKYEPDLSYYYAKLRALKIRADQLG